MNKKEQENQDKQQISEDIKKIQSKLEKLVVKLANMQMLNEAAYLRKSILEIKRALRGM